MSRIALGISYVGARYHGYQVQKLYPSVQAALELAIEKVAGHHVISYCAGRTDKGVHALLQVVHFDTEAIRECHQWVRGINANLPEDIKVIWAKEVLEDFHSRFSAYSRSYVYVLNTKEGDLFLEPYSWYVGELDLELMLDASEVLLGEHDFYAFQSRHCQAEHAIRRVTECRMEKVGDLVYCHISANAFVHHMVRKIMATLVAVGQKKLDKNQLAKILMEKNREAVPGQAPAKGLFLKAVGYHERYGIPRKINSQLLGVLDV